MGRTRTIDRNMVLDAAEALVMEEGAPALSMGAVAAAAGISKGGVQSCFGTKEALLAAMLERWMREEGALFAGLAGEEATDEQRALAHVRATRHYAEGKHRRAASLLALLLQSPAHLAQVRQWYGERSGFGAAGDPAARRSRLAFLATEGAFFLRFFGLLPIDAATWDAILEDAETLIVGEPD